MGKEKLSRTTGPGKGKSRLTPMVLLVCFTSITTFQTRAANIDCEQTRTKIEKLICSNDDLINQDQELNELYLDVLDASDEPDKIRQQQRLWLKQRNACGNKKCISDYYLARQSALQIEIERMDRLFKDSGTPSAERPLWHSLQRLIRAVQNAKRMEKVVYGPYRLHQSNLKCAKCAKYDLSNENHAMESSLQQQCDGIIESLKSGTARLPHAVATISKQEELDSYFKLVSHIAADYYSTGVEPRIRDEYQRQYKGDKKRTQDSINFHKAATLKDLLDRDAYDLLYFPRIYSLHLANREESSVLAPEKHMALYKNGTPTDGKQNYVQLEYFVDRKYPGTPMEQPGTRLRAAEAKAIDPNNIQDLNMSGAYGHPHRSESSGVLQWQDKVVPWSITHATLNGPNGSHYSAIPMELEKVDDWNFSLKLYSNKSINAAGAICSFAIK